MMEEKTQDWKRHIEAWQKSGLSQRKYCQENQLNPNQFSYEKNKRLRAATRVTKPNPPSSGFALAQINVESSKQTSADLSVKLPNGALISGINENNYALVVKLMEALH